MNKEQLILPRTDNNGDYYISYSQLSTWKKSKREYMRQYFFGEKFTGNDYTEFGTKVGEALENNDFSEFTLKEQKFLKTIPRHDEFERKIKLQMDGFYVLGFIDTNSLSYQEKNGDTVELVKDIADYKTGDVITKKSEYESEKYTQLEIYAGAIRQDTGQLPVNAKVHLIHRTGNAYKGEKLKLGDKFITIIREMTDEKVDDVLKEVQKIAEEISSYYKLFLKMKI